MTMTETTQIPSGEDVAGEATPTTHGDMSEAGAELARHLGWVPGVYSSKVFADRCRDLKIAFRPIFRAVEVTLSSRPSDDDFCWLYDNAQLLCTQLSDTVETLTRQKRIAHARTPSGEIIPRIVPLAEAFLKSVSYRFDAHECSLFLRGFQQSAVLELSEIRNLAAALKLILLEQIAIRGQLLLSTDQSSRIPLQIGVCVDSLREISQTAWQPVLEPLILFDKLLRQDPAAVYPQMDSLSQDLYRNELARVAAHSDSTEMQVAQAALDLARAGHSHPDNNPRIAARQAHVGYYIIDKGSPLLYERVVYRAPLIRIVQDFLRKYPDDVLVPGISLLTFGAMCVIGLLFVDPHSSLELISFLMALLLLPCSQGAVELMNYLITSFLGPKILPKLNFSGGVPSGCETLVAVPSLLLNEKQVRGLVQTLEVRYLGNHDSNIHFALLTDLPDAQESPREDSPLVDLCLDLIKELNNKYASRGSGTFFLLHRHRVYNPRERVWMGWERKRGKLLDLNKLLRNEFDSFPVKAGDLSLLSKVRYVITLDSDTELPRGSAHRMIGALAHPLNQAVIDPDKNIVVDGYGILQPRVAISVQSTASSRLASIYAGETGFDIYTRAVSDAYQELHGEGIFTGKGIYEVATLHQVLDRRFPRNSLLSHDLIEGAYTRAGLVSDIEIVEDYPSHYSAHNRRKHRWLRGDWQIVQWLFSRVPDESGALVENPLHIISVWKIFDNLRRSLVEPATFFLFLFVWLVAELPPLRWTAIALGILFLPALIIFLSNFVRAAVSGEMTRLSGAWNSLGTTLLNTSFQLIFLAHQTLLSLDAVARALIRRNLTHHLLLEWETAEQAELGAKKRSPADVYLEWTPALATLIAVLVLMFRPQALPAALPILLLWACSKNISAWLNEPPVEAVKEMTEKDVTLLRSACLHTWRYFSDFSTEEHNWLIPDNVQEDPFVVAARVSPTNLGLALNARQVACELGYISVTEFAKQALRTLDTLSHLRKYRGHLLNWYDTRTLKPLKPHFVSSVDSGNLLASLWTLQQGALDLLRKPLLTKSLLDGLLDHLRVIADLHAFSRERLAELELLSSGDWVKASTTISDADFLDARRLAAQEESSQISWFAKQAELRWRTIQTTLRAFAPWMLPEFQSLREASVLDLQSLRSLPCAQLPDALLHVERQLAKAGGGNAPTEHKLLIESFSGALAVARENIIGLVREIQQIADDSNLLAEEMDFSFLLNRNRKLLSIGLDADTEKIHAACYDLLASEARIAVFTAIAKEDIPQETWFALGRTHTIDHRRPVLISWTGTMFEYLMPSLWMRSYSNTLLDRSRSAAVYSQQAYASSRKVPWGISESAYADKDDAGNYQYRAFGLPNLALHKDEQNRLVISPYSTFLALSVDPVATVRNLRRMEKLGWLGKYGFYEAADYTSSKIKRGRRQPDIVRCWMAHHQGMSLLAMANFFNDDLVQRWFHSDLRVQATELLLHEKPIVNLPKDRLIRKTAAAQGKKSMRQLRPSILILIAALALLAARSGAQTPQATEVITINEKTPSQPFPHFWEQMFGSGRAILSLRESYRQDLRDTERITGFRYVRFHGILNDEVGVYTEDKAGNPVYNFSYVDQIYDGLLANHVKPFVELSFMPNALAAKQILHPFWYKPDVSPPKDWEKWDALITAFAVHLIDRYGIDEVASWYFEVWNEPNLDFWAGDPKQATYWQLYDHTARALKKVNPRLRVGGPATAQAAWVTAFIEHCVENRVPVDFVSTHVYGNDRAQDIFGTDETIPREKMVCRAVGRVHGEIKSSSLPDLPLIWSEFNASYMNEPEVTDSIYMAPWLADTVRQCDGLVDMMSYWTFSDVFEEQGVVKTPFYGGYGLIAEDGIHKPAYEAFELLHKLGERRIPTDSDDVLLTRRSDGTIVAALWNNTPPGQTGSPKKFTLRIENGIHHASIWRVDEAHAQVRSAYEAMGHPSYPTEDRIRQLRAAAEVAPPEKTDLKNSTLTIEVPSPGLALVELR